MIGLVGAFPIFRLLGMDPGAHAIAANEVCLHQTSQANCKEEESAATAMLMIT